MCRALPSTRSLAPEGLGGRRWTPLNFNLNFELELELELELETCLDYESHLESVILS